MDVVNYLRTQIIETNWDMWPRRLAPPSIWLKSIIDNSTEAI